MGQCLFFFLSLSRSCVLSPLYLWTYRGICDLLHALLVECGNILLEQFAASSFPPLEASFSCAPESPSDGAFSPEWSTSETSIVVGSGFSTDIFVDSP